MSKRKTKKGKKRILEGHKRVGKRFIPPMKQIPMMTNTSYVDDMLPELIWIGLINERVVYIRGARIIERVFLAVDKLKQELLVEFLEEALSEDPDSYDSGTIKEMIEVRKGWLNAQLADWATEVNVGSCLECRHERWQNKLDGNKFTSMRMSHLVVRCITCGSILEYTMSRLAQILYISGTLFQKYVGRQPIRILYIVLRSTYRSHSNSLMRKWV